MDKKTFTSYLTRGLKGLPLEKQRSLLEEMRSEWIPEYTEKKFKKYSLCDECGQYSLIEDNKRVYERENRIVPTYIDAGYGDNDKTGEVEFIVEYSVCPLCLAKKEKGKTYVRTLWEKGRYE